jgi:LPXTG-motif cell wall-anchored protein
MKKIGILLVLVFALLFNSFPSVYAAGSATLGFSQSTFTTSVGSTFTVGITVNPGTDAISSTDAHVTYDSTVLEAQSVTAGTYFPSVNQTITAGKVSIFASVIDPASSKTGQGTIATITFKGLKIGTDNLVLFCDTTAYNTSKVIRDDADATNIISCAQSGTATVTVGAGGSDSLTPTTSPLVDTPTPITQLPTTGFVEDLSMYGLIGVALIVVGGIVRIKFL